eukprot:366212-Chlamydomonas_euryale.AAC.41
MRSLWREVAFPIVRRRSVVRGVTVQIIARRDMCKQRRHLRWAAQRIDLQTEQWMRAELAHIKHGRHAHARRRMRQTACKTCVPSGGKPVSRLGTPFQLPALAYLTQTQEAHQVCGHATIDEHRDEHDVQCARLHHAPVLAVFFARVECQRKCHGAAQPRPPHHKLLLAWDVALGRPDAVDAHDHRADVECAGHCEHQQRQHLRCAGAALR